MSDPYWEKAEELVDKDSVAKVDEVAAALRHVATDTARAEREQVIEFLYHKANVMDASRALRQVAEEIRVLPFTVPPKE